MTNAVMARQKKHGKDSLENKYEACEKYLKEAMKCLENDKDKELKQLCTKIQKMRNELYKVIQ